MDKTLAGLIGAVGALTAATPLQAATGAPVNVEAALQALSYADLLKPIPNALALWKASDTLPEQAEPDATFQDAQYHDHHHHHHHRRRHRHFVVVPPAPPPFPHHHHHHHHHAAVVVVPPQN